MFGLANLAFLEPGLLYALLTLPLVWLVVRSLPPQPKRLDFPGIRLLMRPDQDSPPPTGTPWWLILLRILIAALLIIAMARPVLRPEAGLPGTGDLLIVMDNGWPAAGDWTDRREAGEALITQAAREGRNVRLLLTAPPHGGFEQLPERLRAGAVITAGEYTAEAVLAGTSPFIPDHAGTRAHLAELPAAAQTGAVIWISDGLVHEGTMELADMLSAFGSLSVRTNGAWPQAVAMLPPDFDGTDIRLRLRRAPDQPAAEALITARAAGGRILEQGRALFAAGAVEARVTLSFTDAERSALESLQATPATSAATTYYLDSLTGRPRIGIAGEGTGADRSPFLSPGFYLARALEPHAAVLQAGTARLLDDDVGIVFLADAGEVRTSLEARLANWINDGGVLIRFAGPHMDSNMQNLLPTPLRSGDRVTGGSMSWDVPQSIAPFAEESPFYGLEIPADVTVSRQVLAAPDPALADKIWARLEDGTPLVTAARQGDGLIVLFHTTASPEWSNLAISGLFVEMLRRLLPFAETSALADTGGEGGRLAITAAMTGDGTLADPELPSNLNLANLDTLAASPSQSPGLYGPPGRSVALNLMREAGPINKDFRLRSLQSAGIARTTTLVRETEQALAGDLLLAAALLFLADFLISLYLRGIRPGRGLFTRAAGVSLLFLALLPEAEAQTGDGILEEAIQRTRIAYVPTGDAAHDATVHEGLVRLGEILRLRTAVDLAAPMPLSADDPTILAFPLLYFPVPETANNLPDSTLENLARYLSAGGMILFDTGLNDEAGQSFGVNNPEAEAALQRLLEGMSVPPLTPVDQDHVLSKSYYLLDRFPGRVAGRPVWVEAASSGEDPAVTGIIIGSHDWAGQWAVGYGDVGSGRLNSPGFNDTYWQSELAYRFGVNLVMYALTGTYKNDQLHLPTILERLGQ